MYIHVRILYQVCTRDTGGKNIAPTKISLLTLKIYKYEYACKYLQYHVMIICYKLRKDLYIYVNLLINICK